jgi:chromosome segregation ATPase
MNVTRERLRELEAKKAALESETGSLEGKVARRRCVLQKVNEKIAARRTELQRVRAELANEECSIGQLRRELDAARAENAALVKTNLALVGQLRESGTALTQGLSAARVTLQKRADQESADMSDLLAALRPSSMNYTDAVVAGNANVPSKPPATHTGTVNDLP